MSNLVTLVEVPGAVPAAAAAHGIRALKAERTQAGADVFEDGARAVLATIESGLRKSTSDTLPNLDTPAK